jgi:hypothetical protein
MSQLIQRQWQEQTVGDVRNTKSLGLLPLAFAECLEHDYIWRGLIERFDARSARADKERSGGRYFTTACHLRQPVIPYHWYSPLFRLVKLGTLARRAK